MVDMQSESTLERLRRARLVPESRQAEGLAVLFEALELSDLDLMTIGDLLPYGFESEDDGLTVVLGLLFAVLSEGSLCLGLDPDDLQAGVLNHADPAVTPLVDGFIRRLDRGCYDRLIDRFGEGSFKPLVLDGRSGRRLLYFQKFHFHENRLKRRLADFLSVPAAGNLTDATVRAVIDALYRDDAVIRKGRERIPIVRDPFQTEAIRAALTASLLVVSGGPGTGKTSLLVNILRSLVRTGTDPSRIVLAAPTGRAAQRMTEAMVAGLSTIAHPDGRDLSLGRLTGSTLHKLLVFRGRTGGFLYGEHRPIPADVIVVDEVSMVDVVMMDHLLQAIDPHHTRLILMGDKDQLPSVEAGSVLADMSPTADNAFADHFVMLHHVYRSGGQLTELARAINAGDPVPLNPIEFDQALTRDSGAWAFVTATDRFTVERHIDRWTQIQYVLRKNENGDGYADLVRRFDRSSGLPDGGAQNQPNQLIDTLFSAAYRCRLLTVLRHGASGAQWANALIGTALARILDPSGSPDDRLFHGALIMITRNDYDRQLFNGDLGLVLRQADGTYRVYFKRAGGISAFPASGLPDWDLAFAMTVHKSQGSEFDDTLLLLPENSEHRLLTREIIYTAATRASHRLIVCGAPEAFHTALKRKIHRQSGLGLCAG